MNMDENINHINRKLSEQLPSHSPDKGSWQSLSEKLDMLDAQTAYQERLQELPVHSPDEGTWNLIYSRLNRIAYYKTGIRVALSVAAGLLLFFTVSRISDQFQNKPKTVPQVASQQKSSTPTATLIPVHPVTSQETVKLKPVQNPRNSFLDSNLVAKTAGFQTEKSVRSETKIISSGIAGNARNAGSHVIQKSLPDVTGSEAAISGSGNQILKQPEAGAETALSQNGNAQNNETPVKTHDNAVLIIQSTPIQEDTSLANELLKAETEQKSILFQKEQYATTPSPIKYSAPIDLKPVSNKSYFALAMNYLPENINNGTDNSLFHNVDLTASYNKEKVRFNTSLGMAYNEEQLEFQVSYNINTPVTAYGQGGKLDTLSFNSADMASEYTGNEKHEYFTYNLGLGKRLFSSGKFSTWINFGAGFGLLINNPDIVASTTNLVKSQNNALSVRVNSSKPVYNDVNVNFVSAIDFNYMIIKRLSFTFTPTSRWYLKPVLSLNNEATDKLTLGFKTGIKFDF